MAIASATSTSFDAARASSAAAAPVFGMSTEDPTTQPYRQEAEMSFGDFLDIINPLQHIPLVSTLYREITGDTIGQPARVMGGFLYGGPLGGMAAVVNVMVEDATGKDIGDQLLSAMSGDSGTPAAERLSSQPIALTPQGEAAQKLAAQQAAQQTAQQTMAPQGQAAAAPAATAPQTQAQIQAQAQAAAPVQVAQLPAAQAPATPHGAGMATSALMARTNAAAPLSAERSQELQQQLLNGQYHPSRMPTRDATPASTVQAKHAASLAARQWTAQGGTVPPSIAVAAAGRNGGTAPAAAAGTAPFTAKAASSNPAATAASASAATAASANAALAAAAAAAQPAASGTAAAAPAGTAAANTVPQPGTPAPVAPDMLSDVMMRNLAKYEAARKALNPTTPVIRTN